MKGLIRNNFYSMESNMGISFLIAACLAATPLLLPDSNFIPRIISIQIFIFIVNTGTSLHADTVAKWNKYELTLPVGRKEACLCCCRNYAFGRICPVSMDRRHEYAPSLCSSYLYTECPGDLHCFLLYFCGNLSA